MKTRFKSLIIICITGLIFTSCSKEECMEGHGPIVTQTLNLANFSGVETEGSFNVEITQGVSQHVSAVGNGNIISMIETQVRGGVWHLKLKDGCYRDYLLTIYITLPEVHSIDLNGSGNVDLGDFKQKGDLHLGIYGSGNIQVASLQDIHRVSTSIVGSGNVRFHGVPGEVFNHSVSIEGSGNVDGYALMAEYCQVRISGNGNV